MNNSLVLDLQQEILKPDCDVLNALRKAHLIASKLKLIEFDEWILSELNGYYKTSLANAPDYRQVHGQLRAWNPYHGWIPVVLHDSKLEDVLCSRKLGESIDEIIELYRNADGYVIINYPADISNKLDSMCDSPFKTNYSLHVSKHCLKSIIDKVINCLVEWTIKLEENGVLGENMSFNEFESATAKEIPQQIHYYYGTVVNGNVNSSQIVSGNNNIVTYDVGKASEAVKNIKDSFEKESIQKEDYDSAIELLEEISEKIDKNKKPSVIKSALVGLKDFAISVGAEITANMIAMKMQGLF